MKKKHQGHSPQTNIFTHYSHIKQEKLNWNVNSQKVRKELKMKMNYAVSGPRAMYVKPMVFEEMRFTSHSA